MPLSPPQPRQHLHDRHVHCQGYLREDGLWDIEGHLVDTKTYGFDNQDRGGRIEAGEAIHEMRVRLTLDEGFLIVAAEASIDFAPFHICPRVAGDFPQLAGIRIGPGWMREVKRRVGGVKGCTHLVELLGPIATTAYQTMHRAREQARRRQPQSTPPQILNSCHALSQSSPVVKRQWPEFYRPETEDGEES